jgi:hypothetical protein
MEASERKRMKEPEEQNARTQPTYAYPGNLPVATLFFATSKKFVR